MPVQTKTTIQCYPCLLILNLTALQHDSQSVQESIIENRRSFLVDYHPSSRACFNTYTDHRSIPEPASRASLEVPGFSRPPLEYIATDWIWEAHPNGSRAVYEAIVNYSLLHGWKYPSIEAFERVLRSVDEQQRFVSEPEVYHPCDISFCISKDEAYMAVVARQFGYGIVIAQPMGSSEGPDVYDKDAWTKLQLLVKFRFVGGSF
ncbi:hypothetical protein DIS24_g8648 [Lasiodiplodia hormozganensis]|uniref:Uncharacterized protein n=1 Tax=Lasiodiplodia hormozganensis TaxID=869390 RepID=A0AA39XYV1_9PEZI|nr:hypothetical protein DIS24_g8648 [Lasiodiplodia hormozganensis]